jgi:DNA modification methylase
MPETMDAEPQFDRAEELREIWGVQLGDLWQLGEHRLVCGDCTDAAVVGRLMQKGIATLTFTSPPYWVGKEYETQKSVNEIETLILSASKIIAQFTREDESRIVINTSTGFTTSFDKRKKRQTLLLIDKWTDALWELGWNLRHIRHWLKQGQLASISAKADMIDQHCEWLGTYEYDAGQDLTFDDRIDQEEVKALLTFYNARGQGRGRGRESLGNYRNAKHWALRSYWDDIPGEANQNNHCASFPLELVERHIVIYTQRNEIIFEPFLGSGTTLVACERLNRIGRGVELSPAYCAVAIQRFADAFPSIEIKKISP